MNSWSRVLYSLGTQLLFTAPLPSWRKTIPSTNQCFLSRANMRCFGSTDKEIQDIDRMPARLISEIDCSVQKSRLIGTYSINLSDYETSMSSIKLSMLCRVTGILKKLDSTACPCSVLYYRKVEPSLMETDYAWKNCVNRFWNFKIVEFLTEQHSPVSSPRCRLSFLVLPANISRSFATNSTQYWQSPFARHTQWIHLVQSPKHSH